MLLRFILQNFLSFDDAVQFDMFPNLKRTAFAEHIYNAETLPVLKQAAIYGANGAGKSNLIKGIGFLKNFVLDKDFISHIDLSRYFFRLNCDARQEKPLALLVEFSVDDKYFIYSIEVSSKQVEKEGLYISGVGEHEPTLIFERKGEQILFAEMASDAVAQATEKMLKKNHFSSLLALNEEFPIAEDNRVSLAASWFRRRLEVININSTIPVLLKLLQKDKKMMEFTNTLFAELGLGISKVAIETEDFDSWISSHPEQGEKFPIKTLETMKPGTGLARYEANRQIFSINLEDNIRKVSQFLFEQMGKGGYKGSMDILAQSDGTVRLLTLIPAIYKAVYKDSTVVIDEINHCMHPSLIRDLVKYFSKNKNTKGQLIFSTHETCLLNQKEIMRPDEVWFAEKKEGMTYLYSLNDFKIHHSISIQNGYLEGRYGAIPFIGTLD